MIPIFEQGNGRGIGHGLDSFLERFEEICQEPQATGGVRSFGLIFYNFKDVNIKLILRNHDVFTKLDRLSGDRLSIFYLHSATAQGTQRFNTAMASVLGPSKTLRFPSVIFFKLSGSNFTNVSVAELDGTDLVNGFHDLYSIIERYIADQCEEPETGSPAIVWIKGAIKYVSLEAVRAAIRGAIGHVPF